jgi:hypothetical protein
MTAVPAPGNRLPESRSRNHKQTLVANIPLASECGVTAVSDVVRPSPAGGEIAVISVDRKGGIRAQGFEFCDPIFLPQLEKPFRSRFRFGAFPFTYHGWISSQRRGIKL